MSAMPIEVTIRATLLEEPVRPVCAYLFGSRGRQDARDDSDVDIAVLYAEPPARTLTGSGFALQGRLEEQLHLPVDLIVLNHARPEFVHEVLSDGLLLYDHEPEIRVAFEVKSRQEYFDVLPFLHEYRLLTKTRSA